MQSLENLSREELIARVRELQANAAGVDPDFVSRQALKVLDNSGIPALIYETEGGLPILAANACMAGLSGYSCPALTALTLTDLLLPEDVERAQRILRLPREGGFGGGWRHRTASGEVRQIDSSGYDLVFAGRRARFVIAQDITRRRREQLMQQRLASIVETSQDAILSSTMDGVVLSWNRAARRLFGHSAADVVGRSEDVLIPPELRGRELQRIRASILAGRRVENLETVRLHRDGERLEVAVTVAPLADGGGRIVGASTVIRDLRAARQAERSVRLLSAIVESTDEAILCWSPAQRILSWNPGARAMFGYSVEEALGKAVSMLLPAPGNPDEEALHTRTLAGERVNGWETVRRHKNGTVIQVAVTCSPIRAHTGEVTAVACIARDIRRQKLQERLVGESHQRLKLALESAALALWDWDIPGGRVFYSDELAGLLQLAPGPLPQDAFPCQHLAQPEEAAGLQERLAAHLREPGELFERELPVLAGSGEGTLLLMRGRVVSRDRDGHAVRMAGTVQVVGGHAMQSVPEGSPPRRVADSAAVERAVRERERLLESILNNAAEGMIVVSADGTIERINLVAQRMFGYGVEEAQRTNLRQLTVELAYDGQTAGAEERPVQWLRRLLGGRREVTGRRRDGGMFPLELSLSEITLTPGPPKFTALVRDITERKTWENRIYSLAYSDSLTGLPNRLLLRDRLEHAIASAQRNRSLVGVLFLDLDHFKAINDSYGHHAGDQLLREIGERAKGCVREIDTVCRLGGDEFVLVLPDLHEAGDAGAVARKLLAALSRPYAIEGRELAITPTVGVSIYPHHGADADTLIRNADTAMYHAKESGKNDFRFYEAM
ncbi:MAG TPA: PAS domain S-box protein [Burkholderiales bacterium]|nr:PAS domain S-box protein [Burkholderiales bacterium]